jgi:hypothetical protein
MMVFLSVRLLQSYTNPAGLHREAFDDTVGVICVGATTYLAAYCDDSCTADCAARLPYPCCTGRSTDARG